MNHNWKESILHVIYAGRGDCLLLEYGPAHDRKYILIDGGPKAFTGNPTDNSTAPYHKYLASACADIKGGKNFSGIVISHPDEDHYGGLLHAWAQPNAAPNIDFPFFIPEDEHSGENAYSRFNGTLRNRKVGVRKLTDNYLLKPLKTIFPPVKGIRYYDSVGSNNFANETLEYNTNYDKNKRSILMYTHTPNDPDDMGMFFTGDSHADIIHEHMTAAFPQESRRRFSVYKIQHHGSIYDNQLRLYAPYFDWHLIREGYLLALIQVIEDDGYIPNPEYDVAVNYAAGIMKGILLNAHSNNVFQAQDYYTKLQQRCLLVRQNQLEPLGKPDITGRGTAARALHTTIVPASGTEAPVLDINPVDLLTELDEQIKNDLNFPERNQWVKWLNDTETGEYMSYLAVRNVRNFYESFRSDVYVVSANGRNFHPKPEVLLGLALAVKSQNRPARLYVTSADSIDVDRLTRLTKLMNMGSMQELFNGQHLRISYLSLGSYMSISGLSQGVESLHYNIDRDIIGNTEVINFELNTDVERKELHDRMERLSEPASVRTVRCRVTYRNPVTSALQYLFLHRDNGHVQFNITDPNRHPTNFWIDKETMVLLPSGNYEFRCRIGRYSTDSVTILCRIAGTDSDGIEVWNISDHTNANVFFRDGLGLIRFGAQTDRTKWLEFSFMEVNDSHLQQEAHPANDNWHVNAQAPLFTNMVHSNSVINQEIEIVPRVTVQRIKGHLVYGIDAASSPSGDLDESNGLAHETIPDHALSVGIPVHQKTDFHANGKHTPPVTLTNTEGKPGPTMSLVHFLVANRGVKDTGVTVGDALQHLIGRKNFKALFPKPGTSAYLLAMLACHVDSVKSTLTSFTTVHGMQADRVTLHIAQAKNFTVTLQGENWEISSAHLYMEWLKPKTLKITTEAKSSLGLCLSTEKRLDNATDHELSLPRVLEELKVPIPQNGLQLLDVMAIVLRDRFKMRRRLSQQLPSIFLRYGLATSIIYMDQSTAQLAASPLGTGYISNACLVCLPADEKWPKSIKIAGFEFSLNNIQVKLENCGSALQEIVTVEASASLFKSGTSNLDLNMACVLNEKQCILLFSAHKTSIKDLVKKIAETDMNDILNVELPLMKGPEEKGPAPSLGTAQKLHEVGFSLAQPVEGIASYNLHSIWIKTSFSEWTQFLPDPSKFKDIQGSAMVQVLNPTRKASRRVGVAVEFILPIPGKTGKQLSASFSAMPLAIKGEYDYRLRLMGTQEGVTVPEITAAVGLQDIAAETLKGMPFLEGAFKIVHIRELSISVDKVQGKWQFSEWLLNVYVSSFDIIPNALALSDAEFRIEKFTDGLRAEGEAVFRSEQLQKSAAVAFALPYAETPGFVRFDAPGGLSLEDVFSIFQLGSISDIPVLNEVGQINITFCEVQFGKKHESKDLEITSFAVKLHRPGLQIGPFKLQDAVFSIDWRREHVHQKEQKSALRFSVSALLSNIHSIITVDYDGPKGTLQASIVSDVRAPLKVASALGCLVPSLDSALSPLIGALSMSDATVALKLKDKSVQSFDLRFVDGSTLQLPAGEKSLKLSSLSIHYARGGKSLPAPNHSTGKPTDHVTPSKTPTKFDLDAKVLISNVEMNIHLHSHTTGVREVGFVITAMAKDTKAMPQMNLLLADFGLGTPDTLKPTGCPEFPSDVGEVTGKLQEVSAPGQKKGYKLAELGFKIETNHEIAVLDNPKVSLEGLFLKVEYKAADKHPLTAVVWGRVVVSSVVSAELSYWKINGEEQFHGDVKVDQHHLDSKAILDKFLHKDDCDISRMGQSGSFPLQHLGFTFKPKKSIIVTAQATSAAHPWAGDCCGVKFTLSEFSLRLMAVRVPEDKEHKLPERYTYEAFIGAKMSMPGFASATAMLNIQRGKDSTLAATLKRSVEDGSELSLVTTHVSQEAGDWKSVAAQPNTMRFKAGAKLLVNFTKSTFLIFGDVENIGSALLLAKKKQSGQGYAYYFSLQAEHITQVWQSGSVHIDISDAFGVNKVLMTVLTYEGTVKHLQGELSDCETMFLANQTGLTDVMVKPGDVTHSAVPASPATLTAFPKLLPLEETEHLVTGAWILVDIGFGMDKDMSKALQMCINTAKPGEHAKPTLTMFAQVSKIDRVYKVFVKNLQLLDGVINIAKAGGVYSPALGEKGKAPTRERQLLITSDVDIHGLEKTVTLHTQLYIGHEVTKITGQASTAILTEPLKGMLNVHLSHLRIDGIISKTNHRVVILAQALIGMPDKPLTSSLAAEIHFKGAKPNLVVVEYSKDQQSTLTGHEVFDSIIKPGGGKEAEAAHWPEDIPAVQFKNAFIYYNASDKYRDTEKQRTYAAGFSIGAQLDVFSTPFDVQASIKGRAGLSISGELQKTIDLKFAQFTGRMIDGKRLPGPELSIEASKSNKKYQIWAGLTFLNQELPDIDLQYNTNVKGLKGTVHFDKDPFKGAAISFIYKDGHLYFEDWICSRVLDISKKLNDAIKKASTKDVCEAIVQDVFDKVVQSKFHFSLDFPKDKSKALDPKGLHLVVPWSCTVSLAGSDLGTFSIGDLPLTIARPWSLDDFWERIPGRVLANIEDIAASLIRNPEVFGKVLAKMAVERFTMETLNAIFCRRVKDKEVLRKARITTNSNWSKLLEKIKKAWELVKKLRAALAAGSLLAAFSTLIELLELIFIILVVIVVIIKLIEYLIDLSDKADDTEGRDEMKRLHKEVTDQKTELEKEQASFSKEMEHEMFKKGQAKVSFAKDSRDEVCVTWNPVELPKERGSLVWKISYSTDKDFKHNKKDFTLDNASASSHQYKDEEYRYATEVFVRIKAEMALIFRDGEKELRKTQTLENTMSVTHVALLIRPTNINMAIKGSDPVKAIVSFDTQPGQYEVQIYAQSSVDKHPLYRGLLTATQHESHIIREVDLISRRQDDFGAVSDSVRARVRAISAESSHENSEWSEFNGWLRAKRYLLKQAAEMYNKWIMISWDETPFKTYRILILGSDDKKLAETQLTATSAHRGRVEYLSPVPDGVKEGDILSVIVEPEGVPKDVCPLLYVTLVTIAYVPFVIIDDEGPAVDMAKNELSLEIRYSFSPSEVTLEIEETNSGGETKQIDASRMTVTLKGETSGYITMRNWRPPYPTSLTIVTKHKTAHVVRRGPAWKVLPLPDALPPVTDIRVGVKEGVLSIEWSYPQNVTNCAIQAKMGGKQMLIEHTDPAGQRQGSTSIPNMPLFNEDGTGKEATITITSKQGHRISGMSATKTFTAPAAFTQWTKSELAFSHQHHVSPTSGLTVATKDKCPSFFWFNQNNHLVVGRADGHSRDPDVLRTDNHFSSSLASTSMHGNHEEVYWITRNGAVDGLVNDSFPPKFSRGMYKTVRDNIAITKHGGSMVAVTDRNTSTLHLWWVGTAWNQEAQAQVPTIMYSNCKPNIYWSEPQPWCYNNQEVYLDEHGITPLAASVSGDYTTVLFLSKYKFLESFTRQNSTPLRNWVDYDYTFSNIGGKNEARMSPQSAPCIVNLGTDQHRVFWITENGAVITSLDKPGRRPTDNVPDMMYADCKSLVAPAGSACVRSDIAVIVAPNGDAADMRAWWFAPDGRLMGAKAENGKHRKPAWTVYEQAPPGSGAREGRMRVFVTSYHKDSLIRVWWVDGEGRIRWQAPTATLRL